MGRCFRSTWTVRGLRETDLPAVRKILECRVRGPDTGEVLTGEVRDIVEGMREALLGQRPACFLAAVSERGSTLGVLGMRSPTPAMKHFARGLHSVEMIHAFVAVDLAGQGVGTALVDALEERARLDGHDEMLLNSGPRYAATGWGFFDRQPGYERRGVLRDFYGPGQDAPVWGKAL